MIQRLWAGVNTPRPMQPVTDLLTAGNAWPVHVCVAPPEADDTRYRCIICSVRMPWDAAHETANHVRAARLSADELTTEPALLVAWGLFAQQMGPIKGLEGVPISRRPLHYY